MRRNSAKQIALGGLMGALAIVIMCLGGLIPFATFVCPMFCCMITKIVLTMCGRRIAWAWYGAVEFLRLLMSPDKEAAAVFCCLGYYPILKPKLETIKGQWIWKLLVFNVPMIALYSVLIRILGVAEVTGESEELAGVMLAVLLLLGNVTFIALDRLLTILDLRLRRRKR